MGGPGDDTIEGKAGDDHTIFGEASTPETDTIVGAAGDGSDTLDFSSLPAADPVTVDLQSDVATAVHTNRVVKTSGAGQASFFERVIGGAFVMDADGNNIRRITTHVKVDQKPEWSRDGQTIVFSRTATIKRSFTQLTLKTRRLHA